jgi:hypothetical protein
MPRYVIERNIPEAGKFSPQELQSISKHSCGVIDVMGTQIQWVQSYVTADRIYCIYNAASEELVLEHARRSGFPADRVSQVMSVIDPVTAESSSIRV